MHHYTHVEKDESRSPGLENSPRIHLIDSGMDNNCPTYVLLHPKRQIDVIINMDASSDVQKDTFQERVDQIVVHLDVDVIDPGEFPLCNVPNYTGIGYSETMTALKTFLKSEKAVALSVAEVNPDHDPGLEMTGRLVGDLVAGLSL